MSSAASAQVSAPGVVSLAGELDFAQAVALRAQLERALVSAGSQVTLDFAGVVRSNSVGLSLILAAARLLEQRGGRLQVASLPEGLQSIAAVCELDEWLASITVDTPAQA